MSTTNKAGVTSTTLAEESFRHHWDMSDERRIDDVWVSGLCCDCGAFVPYGQEVAHVAEALAPLLRKAKAEALRGAAADGVPDHDATDWLLERADQIEDAK